MDAKRAGDRPLISPTDRAIAEAAKTGKPVPVAELTDGVSETVATPAGHLKRTEHVEPQRVKQNGTWAPLDGMLVPDGQGGYRPKTALSGVHLSGGGQGPLGTLTSADGETLTIDSPFPLTKPTLDPAGEALLYPEVAPGIDLKVTVSKFGGLSTVLVVKTAEAAKNPALKKVRFGTKGKGVTVRADRTGRLTAETVDGKSRWHAPTPRMWDSSAAPAAPAKSAQAPNGSAADAPLAASGHRSTSDGPGDGAKVTDMPVTVTGDAVELTTDDSVLGKGQGPWFIDPAWIPDLNGSNAWTWTQSGYPDTANIGRTVSNANDPYAHPGVGYQGYRTTKGIERSYYQFDTHWYRGAVINKAIMSMWETESSAYSCTDKYTVDLYATGPISNQTTWNNPPGIVGGRLAEASVPGAGRQGCGDKYQFGYDVTWAYQTYATSNDTMTFGVFARNESDAMAFKRLDYGAAVEIEYDRVPNVPTDTYASPAPTTAVPWAENQGCNGNSIGWMNSASGFNGSVTLNATVGSPVQQSLYGWMGIWDYADTSRADSGQTPLTINGGVAAFQVKQGLLQDGHVYGWDAMATDGLVQRSAGTPACRFGVDLTPPTISVPDVNTLLPEGQLDYTFPPSGNGQVTKKHLDQQGVVPFTAADPAPGGNASGVVCARWSWDPQLAGAGWVCGNDYPTNGVVVTPGRWGTNVLYMQVMDNARNVSPIAQYSFYVPWNPDGPPPVFGDVTGDGAPDILQPDQAGYLRAYNAPGNSKVRAPAVAAVATPADAPGGKGWNTVQLAHRGTLSGGNNIDDVFAHAPGDPLLRLYQNPGNTGVYGRIDNSVPITKPKCLPTASEDCAWLKAAGYNAVDWSTTLRIAALGDPVTTDLDPKLGFKNKTGLLSVESTGNGADAALWYYPATNANTLGKPVQLAASGWKDKELITPGDWAKQGHPGLWARNLAAAADGPKDDVLAYTFTTGTVTAIDNQGAPITDGSGKPLLVPTLTQMVPVGQRIGWVSTDAYPTLGSDGDLTGNGNPGLWGRKADGSLDIWWGQPTTPGNPSAGYTWLAGGTPIGNISVAPQWWALDGTGDSSSTNTLYKNGGDPKTTYPTGTALTTDHNRAANKATALDGATVYRTTAPVGAGATSPGLDTTQSYSVSAWVKLNNTDSYQTAVSLTGNQASPFYLQYSKAYNNWAFVLPSSDSVTSPEYYSAYDRDGRTATTVGQWTHLTGTYNAATGLATLYVNGLAVGSAKVGTAWKPPAGSLNIGGATFNGKSPSDFVNGAISDVRVYPYALTDPQVNVVATSQSIVHIRSAVNSHKCLDNWGNTAGSPVVIYDCWNGDKQHFSTTRDSRLKTVPNGLCLGTRDANVVDGTPVVSQACTNSAAQTWIRRYDGALYNPASNKCLELPASNTQNATPLGVRQCADQANQHWILDNQTLAGV
ncbi:LamG-like jellyroll fold domain-containing protein [Kitasatospora sp. NPDC005856]|uniref:LamG-like jellyroll fold domain-containing protein n=1 Tax=Kitasatospora sp. NPDC005856 TaxID=3154566 RepID=UPI0033EE019A